MRKLVLVAALFAVTAAFTSPASALPTNGADTLLSGSGGSYSLTFLSSPGGILSHLTNLLPSLGGIVFGGITPLPKPPSAVPEPSALIAFGAGALLIARGLRRRS